MRYGSKRYHEAKELIEKWGMIDVRRYNRDTGETLEKTVETAAQAIEWQDCSDVEATVSQYYNSRTKVKFLVVNQIASVGTHRELTEAK